MRGEVSASAARPGRDRRGRGRRHRAGRLGLGTVLDVAAAGKGHLELVGRVASAASSAMWARSRRTSGGPVEADEPADGDRVEAGHPLGPWLRPSRQAKTIDNMSALMP